MHHLARRTHPVRGAAGIIAATALLLALLPAVPADAAPSVDAVTTTAFHQTAGSGPHGA